MNIWRFTILWTVGSLSRGAIASSVLNSASRLGRAIAHSVRALRGGSGGELSVEAKGTSKFRKLGGIVEPELHKDLRAWEISMEGIDVKPLVGDGIRRDSNGVTLNVCKHHVNLLKGDNASLAIGRKAMTNSLSQSQLSYQSQWSRFRQSFIVICILRDSFDKLLGDVRKFRTSAFADFGKSVEESLHNYNEFIGTDIDIAALMSTRKHLELEEFSQFAVVSARQAWFLFTLVDAGISRFGPQFEVLAFWTRRALGADTDLAKLYKSVTGNERAMSMLLMDDHKHQVGNYCAYLGKQIKLNAELGKSVEFLFRNVLHRSFNVHSDVVGNWMNLVTSAKSDNVIHHKLLDRAMQNDYTQDSQNYWKVGSIIIRTFLDDSLVKEFKEKLHQTWRIDDDWPGFANNMMEFHELTLKGLCQEYLLGRDLSLFKSEMNVAITNAQSDYVPIHDKLAKVESMCLALPAASNIDRRNGLKKVFRLIQANHENVLQRERIVNEKTKTRQGRIERN